MGRSVRTHRSKREICLCPSCLCFYVFMSLFQYEEFAVVETVVRRRVAQVASRHYLFMYNFFKTPIIHMGSQIKWI